MKSPLLTLLLLLAATGISSAQLMLPAIFGDNMVLQQNLANPVWGWDKPGTEVTVTYQGQTKSAKAGEDGKWTVKLDALSANATPTSLSVIGSGSKIIKNILVGEVWVCSGQSNMQWTVQSSHDADLEAMTANFPLIRQIYVPQVGTQEPQKDFKGAWAVCSPATVPQFTAVGFFYGRLLHQALHVPVGLIHNAWGGSAAEAWVERSVLEKDPRFAPLMQRTADAEKVNNSPETQTKYEAALAAWKTRSEAAKKEGKPFTERAPQGPASWLGGKDRPANIYNGVLLPTIGYGIKGAIWYQGETNAARAHEYRALFPLMITHWREKWGQGDFPFYWVQLADFKAEQSAPGDSDWAELREAQTMTMNAVPNGGQAVIIDIGEGKDIHPKNKRDVAERLARWALVKDYGMKLPFRSPQYKSMEVKGPRAFISLDTFGSSLETFDVREARGFAVCGEDKKWHWAEAKILGTDKIEVTCPEVPAPVAVRYAWSDNPVCNVFSKEGLPLTPFRTDDFRMITTPMGQ